MDEVFFFILIKMFFMINIIYLNSPFMPLHKYYIYVYYIPNWRSFLQGKDNESELFQFLTYKIVSV